MLAKYKKIQKAHAMFSSDELRTPALPAQANLCQTSTTREDVTSVTDADE